MASAATNAGFGLFLGLGAVAAVGSLVLGGLAVRDANDIEVQPSGRFSQAQCFFSGEGWNSGCLYAYEANSESLLVERQVQVEEKSAQSRVKGQYAMVGAVVGLGCAVAGMGFRVGSRERDSPPAPAAPTASPPWRPPA